MGAAMATFCALDLAVSLNPVPYTWFSQIISNYYVNLKWPSAFFFCVGLIFSKFLHAGMRTCDWAGCMTAWDA